MNLTDIIMADPYPVPNRGLWFVGSVARMLSRFGKPLWIVPQLADEESRSASAKELQVMVQVPRPPSPTPFSPLPLVLPHAQLLSLAQL